MFKQTEDLKYLAFILDDHITLEKAMKTLSDCAGGTLAAVIKETHVGILVLKAALACLILECVLCWLTGCRAGLLVATVT